MSAATFVIRVEPGGDALHRVLAICHRRAVAIVSLSYAGSEIALTVGGDEQRCRQLKWWLVALRGVVDVDDQQAAWAVGVTRDGHPTGGVGGAGSAAAMSATSTVELFERCGP